MSPGTTSDRHSRPRFPIRLPRLIADALDVSRLPGLKIEMSGDAGCRLLYGVFTSRHPRWRLIQNSRWGVALIALPRTSDEYLRQVSRLTRRRIKHAKEEGFTFRRIDPMERIDEILEVNRSTSERQGRPMHPAYSNEGTVRSYLSRSAEVFGVVDANDVLRAYICVRNCGEVACIERLLGHADALQEGVMYLLVLGVVDWVIQERGGATQPSWLMYDMFPGASPGMRSFKHAIGCRPYRVSWTWRDGGSRLESA